MADLSKIFTPKQIEVNSYDNRHSPIFTISEGSIRSGKTHIDNFLWLKHVGKFKNRNLKFIMTGFSVGSLKKNVLDDMGTVFGMDIKLNAFNEFMLLGNKMCCFGTSDYASYKAIKGMTAYGFYANEVTLQHRNAVDQAIKRCSGEGARMFWDCNPDHPKHYIKTEYIDKSGTKLENGKELIKAWHFTLDDNTFLSKEYIESIKKSTPSGHLYDRDILGLWVASEGMIYKDFNPDLHVVEYIPPDITDWFVGVDWGFKHLGSMVLCGCDSEGDIYVVKEIADVEKSLNWWIEKGKELKEQYGNIPFYCDPARPDNIDEFSRAGLRAVKANNDILGGVTYIATLFKENNLFFYKKGVKYILDEIYQYVWDSNRELPVKANDDVLDSLRYAGYSHKRKPAKKRLAMKSVF